MLIKEMIAELQAMRPRLEEINANLKDKPGYSRDNRGENAWTAYSTSGAMVTECYMLVNLLLRMEAEGYP